MFWVTPQFFESTSRTLDRAQEMGSLGREEGIYLLYCTLLDNLEEAEVPDRECITRERLTRQLNAEYRIDPLVFGTTIRQNPRGARDMERLESKTSVLRESASSMFNFMRSVKT